jgi:hypothetical protein
MNEYIRYEKLIINGQVISKPATHPKLSRYLWVLTASEIYWGFYASLVDIDLSLVGTSFLDFLSVLNTWLH